MRWLCAYAALAALLLTARSGGEDTAASLFPPTEPGFGAVFVETEPPGAAVSLPQHGATFAPTLFPRVPPGTHTLQVRMSRFGSRNVKVEVKEGETTSIRVDLSQDEQRIGTLKKAAARLEVEGQPPQEFDRLAEAVARAPAGARIVLHAARYEESVVLDKQIEIIGSGGQEDTVIHSTAAPCLVVRQARVLVTGIALEGGASAPALEVSGGHLAMKKSSILSDAPVAVMLRGTGTRAAFSAVSITGRGGVGVLADEGAQAGFEKCEIADCRGHGIELRGAARLLARNCFIRDNAGCGVLFQGQASGQLDGCRIAFNGYAGLEWTDGCNPVVRRCKIFEGRGGGVFIHGQAQGTLEGCDIYGNRLAGIEIRDGGDPKVLDTIIHHGDDSGVLVHEGGLGTFERCNIRRNALANMEVRAGGRPRILHCAVTEGFGNGLLFHNDGSGYVEGCEIARNMLPGVEILTKADPEIQDCRVRENLEAGVLVHDAGGGRLTGCTISHNGSNGMEVRGAGFAQMYACTVVSNDYHGVRVHLEGRAVVTDTALRANQAGPLLIRSGGAVDGSGNSYR